MLALSGTTNGRVAHRGFEILERRVGKPLADLAAGERDTHLRWSDVQARPQKTLTSPEWSGNEAGERQYSAFTINVERLKPWHTLTGRMHFFLDHEWMAELGEQLPAFRRHSTCPNTIRRASTPGRDDRLALPHAALEVVDPLRVSGEPDHAHPVSRRAGALAAPADAATQIGVADNDWVELWNRNGVLDCRAVVSPRMPGGSATLPRQGRHLQTPPTEMTGRQGGTDNPSPGCCSSPPT